jgi:hypothetical protein
MEADPVLPPLSAAAPLPNPNGYDFYLAASRSAIEPSLTANPTLSPTPAMPSAADIATIASDAPAFQLLEQGLGLPVRVPARDPFGSSGRALSRLRSLARTLSVKARIEEQQGRWDDAVKTCGDTIQYGETLPRGGELLDHLVGMACSAIGRRPAWSAVDHASSAAAAGAARRLYAIDSARPPLADSFMADKAATLVDIATLMRQPNWRTAVMQIEAPDTSDPAVARAQDELIFTGKQRVIDIVARNCDKQIAAASLPYGAAAPETLPVDPLERVLSPSIAGQTKFRDVFDSAENRLLAVAFALRAYRLARGAYPTGLAQLCPGYLPAVPSDPFARNAPLRYRRSEGAYVLYSVGPDGADDGGRPINPPGSPPGRYVSAESKGDIVAGVDQH